MKHTPFTALIIFLLSTHSLIAQADYTFKQTDKGEIKVYSFVEEEAEFPGGWMALRKYKQDSLVYPAEARGQKIEGSVHVKFIVLEDGTILDPVVTKSVHPSLDNEALRLIQTFPKWTPGRNQGKAVASYFIIPFEFSLTPVDNLIPMPEAKPEAKTKGKKKKKRS